YSLLIIDEYVKILSVRPAFRQISLNLSITEDISVSTLPNVSKIAFISGCTPDVSSGETYNTNLVINVSCIILSLVLTKEPSILRRKILTLPLAVIAL